MSLTLSFDSCPTYYTHLINMLKCAEDDECLFLRDFSRSSSYLILN